MRVATSCEAEELFFESWLAEPAWRCSQYDCEVQKGVAHDLRSVGETGRE